MPDFYSKISHNIDISGFFNQNMELFMSIIDPSQNQQARLQLIEQLKRKGIRNLAVLDVIAKIPRHKFLPTTNAIYAYEDHAQAIDCGQTISQPFVVALMTQALLESGTLENVLEIGTGSGYQTAILSQVCQHVYSVERIETLHQQAQVTLENLNINNIKLRHGDGTQGWPEHAPYDGIIVTAAAKEIPEALLEQLTIDGRLIIPVGRQYVQDLLLITNKAGSYVIKNLDSVVFVPLLPGIEKS